MAFRNLLPASTSARESMFRALGMLFRTLILAFTLIPAGLEAAVRFDVFLGFDGIVPEGAYFPVVFEISNDGPGFQGRVEFVGSMQDRSRARTAVVELPTGTTKRLVLPAFNAARYSSQWDARLLDESGRVRAETTGLRARKQNPRHLPLVAAMTRSLPVFPEIKSRIGPEWQPAAARMLPTLFPDHPMALEGMNLLYLNSQRALELKAPQVNALRAWLLSGGHLVVGIEQAQHVFGTDWLRQLLPCELSGMGMAPNHSSVHEWLVAGRGPIPLTHNTSLMPKDSSSKAESVDFYGSLGTDQAFERAALQIAVGKSINGNATVLMGTSEQPLAITMPLGLGQVTVLLFSPELEPFASWKLKPYFWAKLAGVPQDLFSNSELRRLPTQPADAVVGAMIDSRQVRKLPIGWLLALLVCYLLVIGPFDYFWLKRLKRQMLTWITFPFYVVLFSGLIYFIGYYLRAGETELSELNMVDAIPAGAGTELRGRTFMSLYSPVNAHYRLTGTTPVATLRGESSTQVQDASQVAVRQQGNNFAADVDVPVWTSQLFLSDWNQAAETPFLFSLERDGAGWVAKISNRLGSDAEEIKIAVGDRLHSVGRLAAGQTKTVPLKENGQSLSSLAAQYNGTFNQAVQQRRQAFGGNRMFIDEKLEATTVLSFMDYYKPASGEHYETTFYSPPGVDLSHVIRRGGAVLLAWTPDHAPIKPMNQFSPRRSSRNTLWRVATFPNQH